MAALEDFRKVEPAAFYNYYYLSAVAVGRADDARRELEKAKATGQPDPVLGFLEGLELVREGRFGPAADSILDFGLPMIAAVAYAKAGDKERALALVDSVASNASVEATLVAAVHAVLGDTAQVIDWLTRARRERDYALVTTQVYRAQPPHEHHGLYRDLWDMRDHPEVRSIIESMNVTNLD